MWDDSRLTAALRARSCWPTHHPRHPLVTPRPAAPPRGTPALAPGARCAARSSTPCWWSRCAARLCAGRGTGGAWRRWREPWEGGRCWAGAQGSEDGCAARASRGAAGVQLTLCPAHTSAFAIGPLAKCIHVEEDCLEGRAAHALVTARRAPPTHPPLAPPSPHRPLTTLCATSRTLGAAPGLPRAWWLGGDGVVCVQAEQRGAS